MALEEQQRGTDLRATLAISMAEALAGTSRALTLPDGRQVNVLVPAGIRDGQVIRLEALGDPSSSGGPPGALILTIAIRQSDPNLQQRVPSPSFSQPPTNYPPEAPLPLASVPSQNIPPPPPTRHRISTTPPPRSQGKVIILVGLILLLIVGSASIFAVRNNQIAADRAHATATAQVNATATAQVFDNPTATTNICPDGLSQMQSCQTPHSLRIAYGVESLVEHGFTGKGQTIIDIESFGSPTLQKDVDVFDRQFGLPAIKIKIMSPLGTVPYDPSNQDMFNWASGTAQDVEIMHAIAPDAGIVVLTSPISETQGTIGLPQFRQLIQHAIDHHLGNIISFSWGASEATLKDQAGRQELQKWDALLQQATTQQGITFFDGTGISGATDYEDLKATKLSPTPTIDFPSDEPWVTSVGGTTLLNKGQSAQESAWSSSGGGFSAFFPMPVYQQTLPASVQNLSKNRRGEPDVSADADPFTGMAYYYNGSWSQAGGTSASSLLWAALGAIANQMAGHPLGFINPGLYKVEESSAYTQAFHDIKVGNNDFYSNGKKVKGYAAVPGWDPVTGWGSPNAEVLLPALVEALKQ
jgi:subtilase family serine protease